MQITRNNTLGTFSLTMIIISLVIGLGIFRTGKDVAGAALTPDIMFAAWIIGGIISICGALTFAEIGSRYPLTGGYYKVFSYAYHPSFAFAINCVILISNAASLAGVALIGSEYIMPFIFNESTSPITGSILAAGAILVFYIVNCLGFSLSVRLQNILMAIKIILLLTIIAGIFIPDSHIPTSANLTETDFGIPAILLSLGTAIKGACFAYGGYQQTINFGGEVTEPRRTIPRSICIGISLVILLYLLVNYSYYKIIGFEELKISPGIATAVAEKLFGQSGRAIFSVVLFIAVLGYVNVSLLSNPRVMFAMSGDRILPKAFGNKSTRGVYTVALTVFMAMSLMTLVFMDTFSKILSFTIFLDCLGMIASGIALFILRRRTKQEDNPGIFKIKWFPWIPLVFIAGYVFVGAVITISEPVFALTGIGALSVFLLVYYVILSKNDLCQIFRKSSTIFEDRELYFNAVAPPLMQTSNFVFNTVEDFRKLLQDEQAGHLYTRGQNESLVCPKLAALNPEEYNPENDEHRLIRLYIGLEDPQYLNADLGQALEKI